MMVWTSEEHAHTDDEVRTGTGMRWAEWRRVLDRWEGNKTQLRPIVSYLVNQHHVHHTWAQVIALYYLIERS